MANTAPALQSTGLNTTVITVVGAIGSILTLIVKNITSNNLKQALLVTGGIVSLLGNSFSSLSGYLTPFEHDDNIDGCLKSFITSFVTPINCCCSTSCTLANILNLIFTIAGIVGSIVTLLATDLSFSSSKRETLLIVGGIISIVCNLISSTFAHLTPYPSDSLGKAVALTEVAAKAAEAVAADAVAEKAAEAKNTADSKICLTEAEKARNRADIVARFDRDEKYQRAEKSASEMLKYAPEMLKNKL